MTPPRHRVPWTPRERAWLARVWGVLARETISDRLGRTWVAIVYAAKQMGLRGGVPQGRESIQASAQRTGFDGTTLAALLSRRGVHLVRGYGRDARRAAHVHLMHVDPDAVDAAIRAEMQLETLSHAWTRYRGKITRDGLRAALVAAGLVEPTRERRLKLRMDPKSVDAAVARWRA